MDTIAEEKKSLFAAEPVGRLIAKFAIPCVISLLVNFLYNIVDQIFIGWGVGYLGNGATNVVFPITIIALALALMIGDGGAAYLSLKLGEGDKEKAKQGVGNAIIMVTVVSIILLVVFLVFIEPILTLFGATETLRSYALEYGYVIGIGLPFMMIPAAYGAEIPLTATGIVMKVNQILISILVGISTGAQPIIGFNYGSKDFERVKKSFDIALAASEIVAVIAFLIFQFSPMTVVSLFGAEDALYNEFAVMAFRIFLLFCPLTGFQTVAAIYLQAIGKPVKSAILSLARQIIFFIPTAIILPMFIGVTGVLWTGPVADGLAFLLSLGLILYERKQLKKVEAVA